MHTSKWAAIVVSTFDYAIIIYKDYSLKDILRKIKEPWHYQTRSQNLQEERGGLHSDWIREEWRELLDHLESSTRQASNPRVIARGKGTIWTPHRSQPHSRNEHTSQIATGAVIKQQVQSILCIPASAGGREQRSGDNQQLVSFSQTDSYPSRLHWKNIQCHALHHLILTDSGLQLRKYKYNVTKIAGSSNPRRKAWLWSQTTIWHPNLSSQEAQTMIGIGTTVERAKGQ